MPPFDHIESGDRQGRRPLCQLVKKVSQSSRLGCREFNPIDFPATCAAENLPETSSEWACSTPQPRESATALYPRPHSSSPNQSLCFDLVRSRSGMSLLSCCARKQGIWSLWRRGASSRRPRRATPAAMEREYPFDCQRTSFFDSLIGIGRDADPCVFMPRLQTFSA